MVYYFNSNFYDEKDVQIIISTLLLVLNEKSSLLKDEVKEIESCICYICQNEFYHNLKKYNDTVYSKLDDKNKNTINGIKEKYDFLNMEQSDCNINLEKLIDYLILVVP